MAFVLVCSISLILTLHKLLPQQCSDRVSPDSGQAADAGPACRSFGGAQRMMPHARWLRAPGPQASMVGIIEGPRDVTNVEMPSPRARLKGHIQTG